MRSPFLAGQRDTQKAAMLSLVSDWLGISTNRTSPSPQPALGSIHRLGRRSSLAALSWYWLKSRSRCINPKPFGLVSLKEEMASAAGFCSGRQTRSPAPVDT